MADTGVQIEAQRWIVGHYLPTRFKQQFKEKLVELTWGGKFKFDGVSDDATIVVNISTSGARTAKGKPAIGKFQKIRSDTLYLMHADAATRLLIFTEQDMLEHFINEKKSGRFPPEVDLARVELPELLRKELLDARERASREVSPSS